jgi:hypothetical protein
MAKRTNQATQNDKLILRYLCPEFDLRTAREVALLAGISVTDAFLALNRLADAGHCRRVEQTWNHPIRFARLPLTYRLSA